MKNEMNSGIANNIKMFLGRIFSILSGRRAELQSAGNDDRRQNNLTGGAELGHNTFYFYDKQNIVL